VLPDELKSPETTGKWEKALEDIRTGEEKEQRFMEGIKNMTREIVAKSRVKKKVDFPEEAARPDPDKPRESLGECPACKGEIFENSKAFYCANWRKTKCKFSLWKNDKKSDRPDITPEMMKKLLKEKKLEFDNGTVNINEKAPYYEWVEKENTNNG
jgi:DNA topoisomerase-3